MNKEIMNCESFEIMNRDSWRWASVIAIRNMNPDLLCVTVDGKKEYAIM